MGLTYADGRAKGRQDGGPTNNPKTHGQVVYSTSMDSFQGVYLLWVQQIMREKKGKHKNIPCRKEGHLSEVQTVGFPRCYCWNPPPETNGCVPSATSSVWNNHQNCFCLALGFHLSLPHRVVLQSSSFHPRGPLGPHQSSEPFATSSVAPRPKCL